MTLARKVLVAVALLPLACAYACAAAETRDAHTALQMAEAACRDVRDFDPALTAQDVLICEDLTQRAKMLADEAAGAGGR